MVDIKSHVLQKSPLADCENQAPYQDPWPTPIKMGIWMTYPLLQRLFSIMVMTPLFLGATYVGGLCFYIVLGGILTLSLWEWRRMVGSTTNLWFISGCCYIAGALLAFVGIQHQAPLFFTIWGCFVSSSTCLFWLYTIVWTTDSGAYILGRLLKGPKLAPTISPNKTWSGFFGGILCAIGACYVFITSLHMIFNKYWFMGTVFLSCIAHVGDLIESKVKRLFKVKDMSNLIPGHGGILDRMDSLMFTALVSYAILILTKKILP